MDERIDLFTRFGGTRPMGRALGIGASTVQFWKKSRRIPAPHQPLVMRRAIELGLDITAEDVMWPFPEDRALA